MLYVFGSDKLSLSFRGQGRQNTFEWNEFIYSSVRVSYFDFSLTVEKNVIAQADDLQQCYVNGSLKNSFIF